MSVLDQLKQYSTNVRYQTKKEMNTAELIGSVLIGIIEYLRNLIFGYIRQTGVDTYNDTTGGKTSLLNSYPSPQNGWTVLVRSDETNEGKATLRQWNGSQWINLETAIYEDDIMLSGGSPKTGLQLDNEKADKSLLYESITYNDVVNLNISATKGNSANMRAYYNDDPVRKDGILGKFRVVMITAGQLNVVVLRPGVVSGIYASEVARFQVNVVVGYNEFDLSSLGIEVKEGDYLAPCNTSAVRLAFITSTNSPNVIPRGQSDIYADVNDPVKVTTQNSSDLLYFLYQFDILSLKTLGSGKTVQTYGAVDITGSQTLTGWVSIGDEFLQDGSITRFIAKIATSGTFNFCTGIIDQRNWIIPSSEFSLNLQAGDNMQVTDIQVKQGDRLFMEVNPGILYYNTKGSMFYTADIESEVSSIAGTYPVSFDLTYYDSPFATKTEVQAVRESVANIVIPDSTIRISPDGTKWRVGVDNDGNYTSRRIDIRDWVIIHNSIGKSPINSYWWGAWGMAASERAKDFIHLLTNSIRQRYPNLNDPVLIGSGSTSWERTHNGYDYATNLAPKLSVDTALVILRLGENVTDYTNYEANYGTYLDKIREYAPNAQIIATGVFWKNNITDNAQRNAALSRGIPFVELSDLDQAQYKSFIGDVVWGDDGLQHTVDNSGVSKHPNDNGMAQIATRIDLVVA
ncbi:SGNH/GDSL hydrolase family protein [Dysgonomonas gadei]|uniref:SGNH/GDSL hydrolase family protein n=1 Tax=Dysgonomonas gadei TaxID=156974 RepID=UPI003AF0C0DC